MISYDLDPSLHSSTPEPYLLDDGFSPPPTARAELALDTLPDLSADSAGLAHWLKSGF